jgi:hypothetical protein
MEVIFITWLDGFKENQKNVLWDVVAPAIITCKWKIVRHVRENLLCSVKLIS